MKKQITIHMILGLFVAVLAAAGPPARGGDFTVHGTVLRPGSTTSAGGAFSFREGITTPSSGVTHPEFALGAAVQVASSCPCSSIFEDGFESGDVTAWSSAVPAVAATTGKDDRKE